MKWFKHFSDASEDEVLSAVIDEFGVEGYGAFWLLVEAISRQIENDPRDSVEYSEKKWRKVTGFSTTKLRNFLTFLEKTHRVLIKNSEKEGKTYLDVRIPKIMEIADEYTKKRLRKTLKATPNVQTNSRACPKKNHVDKIRLDKIRKDKKIKKEDISLVFAYWQKTFDHSRAKLTRDRRSKITSRLKEGYSLDDLKRTIDGCKASSYHQGENDQGKVYDSIELLFRNGDKVESFWQYAGESGARAWLKQKQKEGEGNDPTT